jgi:hypothetical protein
LYGEPSKYSGIFNAEGVLYQLNDSSILVSNSLKRKDYSTDNFTVANLNIAGIETIKIRRRGAFGKGVLIGTVSGMVIGSALGSGDDYSGALLAVGLTMAGTVIGAGVGSIKIKIPINRSMDQYNTNKSKLRKRAIKR